MPPKRKTPMKVAPSDNMSVDSDGDSSSSYLSDSSSSNENCSSDGFKDENKSTSALKKFAQSLASQVALLPVIPGICRNSLSTEKSSSSELSEVTACDRVNKSLVSLANTKFGSTKNNFNLDNVEEFSLKSMNGEKSAGGSKNLRNYSLDLLSSGAKKSADDDESDRNLSEISIPGNVENALKNSVSITVATDGKAPLVKPSVVHHKESDAPTLGKKWFDMKRVEMTPEIKRDLLVLKNRAYLDPKRHYKTREEVSGALPKYFQIGTVQDSAFEGLSSKNRLTKKERKSSLVSALVADDAFDKYAKRVSKTVAERNTRGGIKEYKGRFSAKGAKNTNWAKNKKKSTKVERY